MNIFPSSVKVLLVDDDLNISRTLALSLQTQGCQVSVAHSVDEACPLLKNERFDLILTDFRMGDKKGTDLIREARKYDPQVLIAVMTAFASIENAIEVTKEGAFEYLPKPFTQLQLRHLLKRVNLVISLKKENEALRTQELNRDLFTGMTSVASQRLEEFVNKVAPTDATILLIGESGTGKTELARLIHRRSRRAGKPFVVVNCTSLAESLLESEIFGHVRGAFTGAVHDKVGKFELANEGTLFLDEIGDLSVNSQAKLLRFLQEKIFERVGGNQSLSVDTRVIAATNKNLAEAVQNGQFREDLYYRLNIFESVLVPIRHRKEDLPVLIQKFIQEFSALNPRETISSIPGPVQEILLDYSWPGNIREIRNLVERILILARGREVQLTDLPDPVLKARLAGSGSSVKEGAFGTLSEVERDHICRVLESESSLEKAADTLGITKVTLWRKRKEYGLN